MARQVANMRMLLTKYRQWCDALFPAGTFTEKLKIIEDIGQTTQARNYMLAMRLKNRAARHHCEFSLALCPPFAGSALALGAL
jgi:hypothetical protein